MLNVNQRWESIFRDNLGLPPEDYDTASPDALALAKKWKEHDLKLKKLKLEFERTAGERAKHDAERKALLYPRLHDMYPVVLPYKKCIPRMHSREAHVMHDGDIIESNNIRAVFTAHGGCNLTLMGLGGHIEKVFDVSKEMEKLVKKEAKHLLKYPTTVEQLQPVCRLELSRKGVLAAKFRDNVLWSADNKPEAGRYETALYHDENNRPRMAVRTAGAYTEQVWDSSSEDKQVRSWFDWFGKLKFWKKREL